MRFLLLPCFIEIPVFNSNSVDPDQTPRTAASDLGIHCVPGGCDMDLENRDSQMIRFFRLG